MTVFTVYQIVSYIKELLEDNFIDISVVGEISNLQESSTGHYYFTISDNQSSLAAVLFKGDSFKNPLIRNKKYKDGDKVICQGSVGVYSKRGTFQLIVKKISPSGKGDLLKNFEELKKKLSVLGLFEQNKKKKIPLYPKKIAIITALNGAALQDFLQIYERRSIWTNILIIPALVQGEAAAVSLIKAIKQAHLYNERIITISNIETTISKEQAIDVLVLTRGGGSMEDLWSFNDENLAYEIHNSKIPIISAVGHHVDFTIADFVADLRAETPSAAAELLTVSQNKLIKDLQNNKNKLLSLMNLKISHFERIIYPNNPKLIIEKIIEKNNFLKQKLYKLNIIDRSYQYLKIYEKHFLLDDCINKLNYYIEKKFSFLANCLENHHKLLSALNPKETLNRGYCYITDSNNLMINNFKSFSTIPADSTLNINFGDGKGQAKKLH
ncbi:MAG: exodeoxyribonuclease VII large subunit [Oligoflexia bacterium]|nr:exodeoxyribonuclease VII large subunit [Oligoflexia bacterium]